MPHPPDTNSDVLRRLESQGNDLSRPRDIDFTVVFPDENPAQQFANHFRALGYKVSAELTNTAEGFPWDVLVVKLRRFAGVRARSRNPERSLRRTSLSKGRCVPCQCLH